MANVSSAKVSQAKNSGQEKSKDEGGGGKNENKIMSKGVAGSISKIKDSSGLDGAVNGNKTAESNSNQGSDSVLRSASDPVSAKLNGGVGNLQIEKGFKVPLKIEKLNLELSYNGELSLSSEQGEIIFSKQLENERVDSINDIRGGTPISNEQEGLLKSMTDEQYKVFRSKFDPYATEKGAFNLAYFQTTHEAVDEDTARLEEYLRHGIGSMENPERLWYPDPYGMSMEDGLKFMNEDAGAAMEPGQEIVTHMSFWEDYDAGAGILYSGSETLVSSNGRYKFVAGLNGPCIIDTTLPEDGIHESRTDNPGQIIWSAGASEWGSRDGASYNGKMRFQQDGNFVQYGEDGKPIFDAGTAGKGGCRVIMQNDGNLVMYNKNNEAVWSTGVPESR